MCEDHAREYLSQSSEEPTSTAAMAALAQQIAKHMPVGQTAEELAQLDQQSCPVCGITFYEFRNQGRLGCPHDYVCFESQLEPLILNIHGENEHTGKTPKRSPKGSERRTQLIRLRREMKEAVADEDYERASKLRDQIRRIDSAEEK
ncbi:MAG: UvrB/UvrC motif-containing protein [Thermoguttaceae bacterium]